jgi:hypothetical protein
MHLFPARPLANAIISFSHYALKPRSITDFDLSGSSPLADAYSYHQAARLQHAHPSPFDSIPLQTALFFQARYCLDSYLQQCYFIND